MRSARTRPTHMTFTSGLPAYSGANAISPPTVGQPKQLPYHEMPETTPLIRCFVFASAGAPNRRESGMAMGAAPMAKMARRIRPTPVGAPWNGGMNDGRLWLDAGQATAQPAPMSAAH